MWGFCSINIHIHILQEGEGRIKMIIIGPNVYWVSIKMICLCSTVGWVDQFLRFYRYFDEVPAVNKNIWMIKVRRQPDCRGKCRRTISLYIGSLSSFQTRLSTGTPRTRRWLVSPTSRPRAPWPPSPRTASSTPACPPGDIPTQTPRTPPSSPPDPPSPPRCPALTPGLTLSSSLSLDRKRVERE